MSDVVPRNPNAQTVHQRLNNDLFYFAKHAPLMIKDKQGVLMPWEPNLAQRYIHMRLEEQREKTGGWVRALLLKGRQQGGSTYVAARYYHATRSVKGTSVLILSHDGKTTDKLFKMVDRYHNNVHPALRPHTGAANRYQLTFPNIDSDYSVGTAGNENVGRGGTAQKVHGSEAAYWEHDYAIQDGALESIALLPGTEIILESTANGPKGLFYDKCQAALKNKGDYILIFIPWFWQDEYERDPGINFILTKEEEDYKRLYLKSVFPFRRSSIADQQANRKIAWRRAKCIDLATGSGGNPKAGEAKFCMIYPSNPIEAFQSSGISLIRAEAILEARRAHIDDSSAPRVLGVDPAGDSNNADRTVLAYRQGRKFHEAIIHQRMKPMELAGIIIKLIERHDLDMVFIDRGYGEGTIDRLHELGFGRKVIGVAFNERSLYPDIYSNKRSEIIIECAKWINMGSVDIPDDDEIHADLAIMPVDKENSNGLKSIVSKDIIKKDFKRSPDIYDALALTFAYPVRRAHDGVGTFKKAESVPGYTKHNGSSKARARIRRAGRR